MREHAVPNRLRRKSVRRPCQSVCKVLALTAVTPGSIRRAVAGTECSDDHDA